MQSLAKEISAAIEAAGGAIPFEKFMSLALYSQNGFYSTVGQAGRRGDFITSPEVGPLFGNVVAKAIDSCWRRLGAPEKFTVLDVGAGPGTLARSILSSEIESRKQLTLIAVEVSATQRELHPSGAVSQSTMPTEPFVGMIIANELLDNLPFRLFVFDGSWKEAFVGEQNWKFVEILRAVSDTPSWLPPDVAYGTRIPIQMQAQQWLAGASSLLSAGSILVFDYCLTTDQAAGRPWREWLRTYRQHEFGEHYLRNAGLQDITSHVMIDQLELIRKPSQVSSQTDWLTKYGIQDLVEEGKSYWLANASKPDVKALKMRSRISEAEALCDPSGLGNFKVLEWRQS